MALKPWPAVGACGRQAMLVIGAKATLGAGSSHNRGAGLSLRGAKGGLASQQQVRSNPGPGRGSELESSWLQQQSMAKLACIVMQF